MKDLTYYLAHLDEVDALTAPNQGAPPIEDQLAIAVAKNPLLIAAIILQMHNAGYTLL